VRQLLIYIFLVLVAPLTALAADPDYYAVLGIDRSTSQDQIKSAFRKLAMRHHPDRGGSAAAFRAVTEAYGVLGDPESRAQYDKRFKSVKAEPSAQVWSTKDWLRKFDRMQASAVAQNPWYAEHPLALFYHSVIRASYPMWGFDDDETGIKLRFNKAPELSEAIRVQLYELEEKQGWFDLHFVWTSSRPELLKSLLRTKNIRDDEIQLAAEIILSADSDLGADVERNRMGLIARDLLRSNYYNNPAIRTAIEGPLRAYLEKVFPRLNYRYQMSIGEIEARRYLRRTSGWARVVYRCTDFLRTAVESW
jgi:hypothetical protein